MRRMLIVVLIGAALTGVGFGKEFVAEVGDFRCLTDGVRASGKSFYVFNQSRRKLARAVAKSKRGKLGKGYPKGTILQLFPFEAMAKRGGRFNRDGGGWEYFRLNVAADGTTTIAARGGPEVGNVAGSCQGCHVRVAGAHDSVCEFVVGAAGLGLTDEQIAAFQAADPRCK